MQISNKKLLLISNNMCTGKHQHNLYTSFFVVEGEGNFCPNNLSKFVKIDSWGFLQNKIVMFSENAKLAQ